MASFTLHDLAARVKERAQASPDVSYTRKLLDRGIAHCAKKLGEEAVETTIAAIAEDRERLVAETADLWQPAVTAALTAFAHAAGEVGEHDWWLGWAAHRAEVEEGEPEPAGER